MVAVSMRVPMRRRFGGDDKPRGAPPRPPFLFRIRDWRTRLVLVLGRLTA
jgi:hypothetical protein